MPVQPIRDKDSNAKLFQELREQKLNSVAISAKREIPFSD